MTCKIRHGTHRHALQQSGGTSCRYSGWWYCCWLRSLVIKSSNLSPPVLVQLVSKITHLVLRQTTRTSFEAKERVSMLMSSFSSVVSSFCGLSFPSSSEPPASVVGKEQSKRKINQNKRQNETLKRDTHPLWKRSFYVLWLLRKLFHWSASRNPLSYLGIHEYTRLSHAGICQTKKTQQSIVYARAERSITI